MTLLEHRRVNETRSQGEKETLCPNRLPGDELQPLVKPLPCGESAFLPQDWAAEGASHRGPGGVQTWSRGRGAPGTGAVRGRTEELRAPFPAFVTSRPVFNRHIPCQSYQFSLQVNCARFTSWEIQSKRSLFGTPPGFVTGCVFTSKTIDGTEQRPLSLAPDPQEDRADPACIT